MKIILFFILFFFYSCGYPDIDTVPSFKQVDLSEEELFDLCQLSSTDRSEIDTCVNEIQNKK